MEIQTEFVLVQIHHLLKVASQSSDGNPCVFDSQAFVDALHARVHKIRRCLIANAVLHLVVRETRKRQFQMNAILRVNRSFELQKKIQSLAVTAQ
jgi:hypothetical protein